MCCCNSPGEHFCTIRRVEGLAHWHASPSGHWPKPHRADRSVWHGAWVSWAESKMESFVGRGMWLLDGPGGRWGLRTGLLTQFWGGAHPRNPTGTAAVLLGVRGINSPCPIWATFSQQVKVAEQPASSMLCLVSFQKKLMICLDSCSASSVCHDLKKIFSLLMMMT